MTRGLCNPAVSASAESGAAISITVNAEALTVSRGSLADVLVALGYGEQKVATAVNGDFVPERLRAGTLISDGDRIEVLSARQGG